MRCPKCKRSNLVQINLTVSDRELTMRSCSECDSRWWDSGGEELHLPGVLDLASRR